MLETVSQRLRAHLPRLPRAELLVAQALLADYPVAGLNTVASLAKSAEVSAPTVLRLAERIGYSRFPDLQAALRAELHQRSLAPVEQYSDYASAEDPLLRAPAVFTRGVEETFERLNPVDFRSAVELLSSAKNRVYATGGRFTFVLAKNLVQQLEVLRPDTWFLSADDRTTLLTDLTPRDVIFVVDLRRYQPSTVTFGEQAAQRGAKLILLTDRWQSPLASSATAVLTASLDAPHPLDSMVPALAVVEALLAGVVDALGDAPIARMKRYDEAWESRGFSNTYWKRFEGDGSTPLSERFAEQQKEI